MPQGQEAQQDHLKYIESYIDAVKGLSSIGHLSAVKENAPESMIRKLKDMGIMVERTPNSFSHKEVTNLRTLSLDAVFALRDKGIGTRLGVDGLSFHTISLSQWIVMLLLASPENEEWTLDYWQSQTRPESRPENVIPACVREENMKLNSLTEDIHLKLVF